MQAKIWTKDQTDLLKFSLHNIVKTISMIPRYISEKFYLATPFNQGYRLFDLESNSLEDILYKATEILRANELECMNLETVEGIPILRIRLESGPTVIIEDIVTEKTICNILL